MVILRQERIFYFKGKGKFSECWMIIVYDSTGPSILLFKDQTAKKPIYQKLHVPSMATQIRFGTTCIPYGNLPVIKLDPKIDSQCFLAFQIEKRVKKTLQPTVLWLCAESTKQMFAIMKILACGLTIMNFPAPAKNTNTDDVNALHHYRPRILQPSNAWEEFWDNPPNASLVSPMELSKIVARSLDALNVAVQQQAEPIQTPVTTVVKSNSSPEFPTHERRRSTVSRASSSASSRSTLSRSLSGRRIPKQTRVWQLSYTRDMQQIPYSPQKVRKYERQESSRSSPIMLRHRDRLQRRTSAPETALEEAMTQSREIEYAAKTRPPSPPPLPEQLIYVKPKETRHYDIPPSEENAMVSEKHTSVCYCSSPPGHPIQSRTSYSPSRRYSQSVERSSPPSILKASKQQKVEDESASPIKRPVSGYSSSAYGSGHISPSHQIEQPLLPKSEFEVQLLRRMSEISVNPLSNTFTSQPTLIADYYEEPITPPRKEHYYEVIRHSPEYQEEPLLFMPIEEKSAIQSKQRRISDPEFLIKPKARRRQSKLFISQGVQTDHEISQIPLIENFEEIQTKRFTFEDHEPHLNEYRKLSHQSSRSIYIQYLNEGNNYETVRPFFRNDSSSSERSNDGHEYKIDNIKRQSYPVLIDDALGTRTYAVEIEQAGGLL